jgi:hypothetical protein
MFRDRSDVSVCDRKKFENGKLVWSFLRILVREEDVWPMSFYALFVCVGKIIDRHRGLILKRTFKNAGNFHGITKPGAFAGATRTSIAEVSYLTDKNSVGL